MDEAKQAALTRGHDQLGRVPELLRAMVSYHPVVAQAYLAAEAALALHGELEQSERHIVMLAASAKQECKHGIIAHRTLAQDHGAPRAEIDRVASLQPPEDGRLRALVQACWHMMDERGALKDGELHELEQQGVSQADLAAVVAIVGLETIASYFDHLAENTLEEEDEAAHQGDPAPHASA